MEWESQNHDLTEKIKFFSNKIYLEDAEGADVGTFFPSNDAR